MKKMIKNMPKHSTIEKRSSSDNCDLTIFFRKSFIGILIGASTSYMFLLFFLQLGTPEIHASVLSSIVGLLTTLGLIYSHRIRNILLLLLPQLFSRLGSHTLTCYALILILTGPAYNTLMNMHVLHRSLVCEQINMIKTNKEVTKAQELSLSGGLDFIKKCVQFLLTIVQKDFLQKNNKNKDVHPGRENLYPTLIWMCWSISLTSLFLILNIFRAIFYKQKYEASYSFDNRYITQELKLVDRNRCRTNNFSIFPLTRIENQKYIKALSFNLLKSEKKYLNKSIIIMIITTLKLMIHISADYILYWLLTTIGINYSFHFNGHEWLMQDKCLPKPIRPNFNRYVQIGIMIFLLWLFAVLQPYGLRLSRVIMDYYNPKRANARAVWLYHHILRNRGSFLKLARKTLHRQYKYSEHRNLTFNHWLETHLFHRCALLRRFQKSKMCVLCKSCLSDVHVKCSTNNCPGIYCEACFEDLNKMCTICMNPVDYGDFSDLSVYEATSDNSDDDKGFLSTRQSQQYSALEMYDSSSEEIESGFGDTRNTVSQLKKEQRDAATTLIGNSIKQCYDSIINMDNTPKSSKHEKIKRKRKRSHFRICLANRNIKKTKFSKYRYCSVCVLLNKMKIVTLKPDIKPGNEDKHGIQK